MLTRWSRFRGETCWHNELMYNIQVPYSGLNSYHICQCLSNAWQVVTVRMKHAFSASCKYQTTEVNVTPWYFLSWSKRTKYSISSQVSALRSSLIKGAFKRQRSWQILRSPHFRWHSIKDSFGYSCILLYGLFRIEFTPAVTFKRLWIYTDRYRSRHWQWSFLRLSSP